MKLLLVSMPSIHLRRWASQLEGSGHEVHWFDVSDGGPVAGMDWLTHHHGWRYKGGNFKGRTKLKRTFPQLHRLLENDLQKAFAKVLESVKPDAVHSFVMYKSAVPIFQIMQQHSNIPWIYSSWGSDLYLFRHMEPHRADLERVLPHIDYLFTDTQRDVQIAKDLGFEGQVLGVFPGGGGFHLDEYKKFIQPYETRSTILVKGYQGRSGRAIQVMEALELNHDAWQGMDVLVFGADDEVVRHIERSELLSRWVTIGSTKKQMAPHQKVLEWMGGAAIYIGNSDSDGMPNTLLEAMIMGAFPIQSNPGGASAEVIDEGLGGLLINNPMDVSGIAKTIERAVRDQEMRARAFRINQEAKGQWDYDRIRKQVLSCYQTVANSNS